MARTCRTPKLSQTAKTLTFKILSNGSALSNYETLSRNQNRQFKHFVEKRNRFKERLNWPTTSKYLQI